MADTCMSQWQGVMQRPPVVEFFRGLFDHVGVRVPQRGEAFTAHHRGDRIEFSDTLRDDEVDFIVEVTPEQVQRLADHAATGELDAAEQSRVVRALFTPATRATLRNPVLAHRWVRRLSGVEDLIHVRLRSQAPDEPDTEHTLVYAARQWVVAPGLHGSPRRVFELSMADALEYHRHTLEAIKADSFGAWCAFARWYRKWRPTVSKRA